MRPAAVKALQLDPLLAEAHAAMGLLYSRERDWQNAQRSFQRAIDLNPSLTQTYTNYATSTLMPLGKLDEAERLLRRPCEPIRCHWMCNGNWRGADHHRTVRGGHR